MTLPIDPGSTEAEFRSMESRRQEAAEWFVIIHADDEPSSETLQAWLKWMDLNEGNRVAFESVARAWHGTPASAALKLPTTMELQADTYEGDQSVEEWLAAQRTAASLRQPSLRARRRATQARRWVWLAAASLVAVTAGLLAVNRYFTNVGLQTDAFATRNGEQIEITLADGSRVWLGPRSTMQVTFNGKRRGIQLTSGEAFFSVKKDPTRPFVVGSASGDITAVGTAFNVRALADHVTVSVSEGVVAVAPKSQLSAELPAAVRVASGQQLTFTAQESVTELTIDASPSVGERARWRDGVLVYRDEPLRDVVMDVARYSGDMRLELSGDAIGDMRYTGIVYTNAIDEWTTALRESFPVKIVSDGDRRIISAR